MGPTKALRRELDSTYKSLNLKEPYISIHLRTGKYFSGHNERVELHEIAVGYPIHRYAKILRQIGLSLNVHSFYLSIDDLTAVRGFQISMLEQYHPGTVKKSKKRLKEEQKETSPMSDLSGNFSLKFMPFESFPLQKAVTRHGRLEDEFRQGTSYYNDTVDETISMLVNIYIMSHARFFLATGPSQVDVCTKLLMHVGSVSQCTYEVIGGQACWHIHLCRTNWRLAHMWPRADPKRAGNGVRR
eukprot:NODE_3170_length_806_cov_93.892999_g2644_i0.p1 GENE.NODE_3170_length_806_cov_93.892999_g2644_i0~~NODE_3170_length_806_cov_93.892999_g2644_i0.p1  ORF type:complete len:250 (-),score=57.61 NODE_3170_length_806_cov_93.892999_g2644_i0:55-783(-)